MSGINRPNGVQGTNTSNVSAPGMDVINNNSTSTGKIGAPPSTKTGMPAMGGPEKGGSPSSLATQTAGIIELFKNAVSSLTMSGINKAMPTAGKGDVASADGKNLEAGEDGKDSAETKGKSDEKLMEFVGKLFDKALQALEKLGSTSNVASAAGSKGDAGKGDVASAADNKKSGSVFFPNKSEQAAAKPNMGAFDADVTKTAINAVRDMAGAKRANTTPVDA
jgi:hypothetical protein